MRDKRKLTEDLIKHLDYPLSVDEAYKQWWVNPRNTGGLRLTPFGYQTLSEHLELEHWSHRLEPDDINMKFVLNLDRKLQYPFYIKFKKRLPEEIVFFGSKEAVMVKLYGSVKRFLDKIKTE